MCNGDKLETPILLQNVYKRITQNVYGTTLSRIIRATAPNTVEFPQSCL